MKQGRGAAASTHGDVVKGAETTTHAIQEVATIGGAGDVARIVTGSVTLAVDLEKGVARSYSAVPDLAGDKQVVDVRTLAKIGFKSPSDSDYDDDDV
ncbi:hypothetical protein ZWY2020_057714 [Hordeum vulgare]|nr:hypothetical protein ZWY2020_057714 [Hordeum vulgare]